MPYSDRNALVALLNHLDTLANLTDRLGTPCVREAAEADDPAYPSIEYAVLSSPLEENVQGILVQFDFWELELEAGELEPLLFDALHTETARLFDGRWLVVRYVDGRRMPDPEPGRKHSSADYRITVNR